MSILRTIASGLRQAVAFPRVLFLLWLVNVLFALPVTLLMGSVLADSFGDSLVSRTMRDGFDLGWHAEFESGAGDFEKTFRPTISGPGSMLDNLEAWWSGGIVARTSPGLVGLGAGYAVLWALLLGGVLDRLARPREPLALHLFFSAGGRYLPRFLGLAFLSGVLYFLIYWLAKRLYRWIEVASRDVTVEKTVFAWVLVASALVVFLLVAVRMVFDYAKIVTVLGERVSVVAGAAAGLRFVLRHPLKAFGVTLGLGALGLLVAALWFWLAPGAGQSTLAGMVLAFLLSQVYLIARLVLRVGLLGGQMSLYHELGGAAR